MAETVLSNSGLLFQLESLRFSFVARDSIHFAEGKSSNILRGAFGTIFRRIACVPQCPSAANCEWRSSCPYAQMFEPRAALPGPSGLADWPRPFVFRATHLDGKTVAAGQPFYFDLNLFNVASPSVTYFILAFSELVREGLGPGRARVELTSAARLNEHGVSGSPLYENGSIKVESNPAPLTLDLAATSENVSRLTVRFVTPTELKSAQQIALRPQFEILTTRVQSRISNLRELYGGGPLDIEFRAFSERAAAVHMTRCDLTSVELWRRSSRTGQVHSIGGFVGEADYEGDLTEFVPYLQAGKWTGVGRQTVWGKGEIDTKVP